MCYILTKSRSGTMKTKRYDKASRKHIFITFLGTTVIVFLILVSIASDTQDSDAGGKKGNALYKLNRYDEAIKAFDKAIELRGYPKSLADLNVINAHAKCRIAR